MASIETPESKIIQNRLAESKRAKLEYKNRKTEEELGLKPEVPSLAVEGTEVEKLNVVFKEWERRIVETTRVAAENYVRGALKVREKDLEWFRTLNEQMDSQNESVDQFLEGLKEAIVTDVSTMILATLEEVKATLQKIMAKDPLEHETLLKLDKVLDEYS